MKVNLKSKTGLVFELVASDIRDVFIQIAGIQEVFDIDTCGLCNSKDLSYRTFMRRKNGEQIQECVITCSKCGSDLYMIPVQDGTKIFPTKNGWKSKDYNKEQIKEQTNGLDLQNGLPM